MLNVEHKYNDLNISPLARSLTEPQTRDEYDAIEMLMMTFAYTQHRMVVCIDNWPCEANCVVGLKSSGHIL